MTDQEKSWQTAKKYADQYGNLPASFTSLIRALRNDQVENEGQFSHGSKSQLLRLLRGASFKSPIYYAAKTFKSQSFEGRDAFSSKDLLALFSPIEVAVFMGILYLYRKARRVCDEEEWDFIRQELNIPSEIGGYVGLAISNIGLYLGVLATSIPVLGKTAFLMNDVKGYRDYRRSLKIKKLTHDFEYEIKRWGCSHVQISSNLMVSLGFNTDFVEPINIGLAEEEAARCPSKVARATNIVPRWVKALAETGAEPKGKHDPSFYPEREELDWLIAETARIVSDGGSYGWLDRGKEDISPETTPELFEQTGTQNGRSVEGEQNGEADSEGAQEILDELDSSS